MEAFRDSVVAREAPHADDGRKLVRPEVKPNLHARVYFIYVSHSKCVYCKVVAEQFRALYPALKNKDIEVVMLNHDQTLEDAQKWVKENDMKFPVVAPHEAEGIPFPFKGEAEYIYPMMVAVDAQGNRLAEASKTFCLDLVKNWRAYLPREAGVARERSMQVALSQAKFAVGRYNPQAKVFFLLQCYNEEHMDEWLPKVQKAIKKHKSAELIYLARDDDKKRVKRTLQRARAKCATLTGSEGRMVPLLFRKTYYDQDFALLAVDLDGKNLGETGGADAENFLEKVDAIVQEAERAEQQEAGEE